MQLPRRGSKPFPTASGIKLPLRVELFHQNTPARVGPSR